MALTESAGRLLSTLAAMFHTRLELAALELEEETQRLLGYLVLALASLLLFGIAMLMVAVLVIVLFWDSYRIEAVLAMLVLFGVGSAAAALMLRSRFQRRTPLLAGTLAELNKDINVIKNARQYDEQ
jgi:uncharacterized membrane protein YqjE